MDNLTHSLFGLTLARTPLGRNGRGTTVALLLASNAPDIDIVATAGGATSYLEWHRGPTHGPLGIVGLGLLVASIALTAGRRWNREAADPPASFLTLWGVAIVGVACHVLMDLTTSYGTRALSPFSWTWFTVDWMPIVDIYLIAMLAAGLWFGRAYPALRARNATVVLALMLANYGVRAMAHHGAIVRAPAIFGAQLPSLCMDAPPSRSLVAHWPRADSDAPRDRSGTRCLVEIAAMPDFVSPFRWRLIAQLSNAYEVRVVNLIESQPRGSDVRLVSVHYPNQWTPAVEKAAAAHVARVFLGFSRFPAVRSAIDAEGNATVRWTDIRFDVDATTPGPRERAPNFFSATVVIGREGTFLLERLGL